MHAILVYYRRLLQELKTQPILYLYKTDSSQILLATNCVISKALSIIVSTIQIQTSVRSSTIRTPSTTPLSKGTQNTKHDLRRQRDFYLASNSNLPPHSHKTNASIQYNQQKTLPLLLLPLNHQYPHFTIHHIHQNIGSFCTEVANQLDTSSHTCNFLIMLP